MTQKKRNPWLAVLLAMLCAGLGDIYATRTRRGFRMFAGYLACVVAAGVLLAFPPTHIALVVAWAALMAASIVLWIAGVVLGFLAARRAGAVPLTRFNRWYVYTGCIAAVVAVTNLSVSKSAPLNRWESFHAPSASMMPTILPGDHYFAWRGAWRDRAPERGALAVFTPAGQTVNYCKRIVGLPGDRVRIRRGRLTINGTPVERNRLADYDAPNDARRASPRYVETMPGSRRYEILERAGDTGPLDDTPEYTVPAGHVFVLGDNRDVSLDSRGIDGTAPGAYSFVPVGDLTAVPTVVYWSRDLARIGLRLE